MTVIALIIFGIAAGFIATRAMRLSVDVPTTIAIGVGVAAGLALRHAPTRRKKDDQNDPHFSRVWPCRCHR